MVITPESRSGLTQKPVKMAGYFQPAANGQETIFDDAGSGWYNECSMDIEEKREMKDKWARFAVWAAVLAFAAIYIPDIGKGFLKDDFAWIAQSRIHSWGDFPALFRHAQGFYRPLVSLSFSLDYALFGLAPWGYGWTNLLLLLLVAIVIHRFGRLLELPGRVAWLAAVLFVFNHQGISMSLLWISGRTSLLLTLFSLLTAIFILRRWRVTAAVCFLLALFSKEEATLLPLTLFFILLLREKKSPHPFRTVVKEIWILLFPLGIYLGLRLLTPAFLPFSAPGYYRFVRQPLRLLRNVLEYADRSATLALLLVFVSSLLLFRFPRPTQKDWRTIAIGSIWFVGGIGLTAFLPLRSSLYAVFPSVGPAFASACLLHSMWQEGRDGGRRRLLTAAMLILIVLVPLYRQRNGRWVMGAETSRQMVEGLKAWAPDVHSARFLVLHDGSRSRDSLASVFGTLIQDGTRLCTGNDTLRVWLDPPLPGWELSGLEPPVAGIPALHLVWKEGRFDRWSD
jgi:MFS family permease